MRRSPNLLLTRQEIVKRIKVKIEKLSEGFAYPCTPNDVKRFLLKLPCSNQIVSKVHLIQFRRGSSQTPWADANPKLGRIRIYAWRTSSNWLYRFYGTQTPQRLFAWKPVFEAGGWVSKNWQGWWLYWPDQRSLAVFFLKYIIVHELGHLNRHDARWSESRAERTAEGFVGYMIRTQRDAEVKPNDILTTVSRFLAKALFPD